ncbi:MAG TPA: trypsin-like peptidase domain-containing protein, partial [Ktedonobacterales bacterium]
MNATTIQLPPVDGEQSATGTPTPAPIPTDTPPLEYPTEALPRARSEVVDADPAAPAAYPWGAAAIPEAATPPFGGGGGWPPAETPARRPRRRPPRFAVLALVLLLTLLVGGGAGAAIASRANSSGTVVLGATSAPAITLSSSTATLQKDAEAVAAAVEPSVVKITSVAQGGEAIGSGDILTSDGYIVTNDHVVRGYSSYSVTLTNGKTYPATLVGQDPQDDLAVLKIAATGLKPIAFANSSTVQVGAFAVAIGYPLGLQESATLGTVSAVNGTASEAPSGPAAELTGLVQTTATIAPGNSGGALVNLQGQLIGIPTLEETNSETGTASGIGYAIPASRVQYVASQLIAHGQLTSTGQGFIGIQAQDVTPQ